MLSATQIAGAKPNGSIQKLWDGGGLYLLLSAKGEKGWRLKYRYLGKEKLLSMGTFPEVGLKLARERRADARRVLAQGLDPSAARKAAKRGQTLKAANTFEAVARRWFDAAKPKWTDGHTKRVLAALERDLFPFIGGQPIDEVTPMVLLPVLRKIEERGAVETAHRCQNYCRQLFDFAIADQCLTTNHAAGLHKALRSTVPGKMAAITDPVELGDFLRAVEGYKGSPVVRHALRLMPHVMVRPGNLRTAQWSQIDLKKKMWRIPAHNMKGSKRDKISGEDHVVPLSSQVLEILESLHPLTSSGTYLFPGARDKRRPMSDNAVLSAMRVMGFGRDEVSGHGFRATASTLLNEHSHFKADVIEAQLAHKEPSAVRGAYMRADYMKTRQEMMQWWSDYLDGCKSLSGFKA
jgi:integrase